MRAILLFVIGLIFGATGGFLVAESGRGDHSHDHSAHNHDALTPWTGPDMIPDIQIAREKGTGANISMSFPGFTFAPDQVNGPVTAGTGHAHIYVNGVKVARAYSGDFHLADVPPDAIVHITLNANDHSEWAMDGVPLAWDIPVP
jgi:hypothetical protein